MDININPAEIIASTTNNTELVFHVSLPKTWPITTAIIEVVKGSFQFNVGGPVAANSPSFEEGDKVPVSFSGGLKNIFFKASAVNDVFRISF